MTKCPKQGCGGQLFPSPWACIFTCDKCKRTFDDTQLAIEGMKEVELVICGICKHPIKPEDIYEGSMMIGEDFKLWERHHDCAIERLKKLVGQINYGMFDVQPVNWVSKGMLVVIPARRWKEPEDDWLKRWVIVDNVKLE